MARKPRFFGWATIEIETMRWIIYSCLTQRLQGIHFRARWNIKQDTYNFLGPETHLGMVKMAVVIMTTHTVHKTMSAVHLASSTGLELLVSLQLGVTEVVAWRDIVLPLPLL